MKMQWPGFLHDSSIMISSIAWLWQDGKYACIALSGCSDILKKKIIIIIRQIRKLVEVQGYGRIINGRIMLNEFYGHDSLARSTIIESFRKTKTKEIRINHAVYMHRVCGHSFISFLFWRKEILIRRPIDITDLSCSMFQEGTLICAPFIFTEKKKTKQTNKQQISVIYWFIQQLKQAVSLATSHSIFSCECALSV